jgi:hypothetical protein
MHKHEARWYGTAPQAIRPDLLQRRKASGRCLDIVAKDLSYIHHQERVLA